jgi:hypothetical protein
MLPGLFGGAKAVKTGSPALLSEKTQEKRDLLRFFPLHRDQASLIIRQLTTQFPKHSIPKVFWRCSYGESELEGVLWQQQLE